MDSTSHTLSRRSAHSYRFRSTAYRVSERGKEAKRPPAHSFLKKMRKQLSTTFSALDEITSTSLDPTPSLGSVLLRGDQSRMVESLLSRLATNPSSSASSSSAATSHHHAAPPAPHSYSDLATTTGPPRPTPVPPQLQWAPAAAICYPYRSPPPQPHYYPAPQQYHYLPPNAALPPLQHHHQQPAQHHHPHHHHPQPQPPQAPSWFIPSEPPPAHQAVISSHVPLFVDGNLTWVSSHHVALQLPQGIWRPTDASMAASVVGGTSSSSSPSSPFTSSPFTSSTSSLHVFSPGRSSSLENVGDLGSIDDSSAVVASFLAGDASDDDGRGPSPAGTPAVREEKRRRLESGERFTSPISSGLGLGLAAPYAGCTTHGHGETGKRKTSDHKQLQNAANDWFGMTDSPDSAFFTGSTSSLPLQLFGATSSFSLSPPSSGAAVSSLPSPSSPPQHCLPTYGDSAGSRDPTSPYVAPSSLFLHHPCDRIEAAEAGPTEEGWPSTNEDAGTRSCASVRPVLDGGRPPAASSP